MGLKLRRNWDLSMCGQEIVDIHYFITILNQRQAYEDDFVLVKEYSFNGFNSSKIFCALCRSLGLLTRSVTSIILYPVTEVNPPEFIFFPRNWVEIFSVTEQKWVPVDCIRAVINCRESFVTRQIGNKKNRAPRHLFVFASDNDRFVTDVTKRYSMNYFSQCWKLRLNEEKHLHRFLSLINKNITSRRYYNESLELDNLASQEPIPETASGFSNHGKYVLESKLRKYEVFWPANEIVGTFKGENIHLRESVKKVRSKDAWYTQFARIVRKDEQPIKTIQLPRKRKRGYVGPEEDAYEPGNMQPLFGEWQTDPFVPLSATNGIIPKNEHGNVDLFQPEMLPNGSAYIPYTKAWKSAKELDIDYANACVGFKFHGRIAVPNLQGVVVCKEYEEQVLNHYFKSIQLELDQKSKKLEQNEYFKLRREALAVKITERIKNEYGDWDSETSVVIQSAFFNHAGNEQEDFKI